MQKASLRRTLGLGAVVVYGIGDILGAGIYAIVGEVAGVAGRYSWLSFAVALTIAALTALSYAELGGRFPRSAGESLFAQRAFRWTPVATTVGWMVLCSTVVSLATISLAFDGYVRGLWNVPSGWPAAAMLLGLGALNFRGIGESSKANIVATLVETAGRLLVIVAGIVFLAPEAPALPIPDAGTGSGDASIWPNILRGSTLAFFAFIGFEDLVNVAEEIKEPERNLPRAILIAVAVSGSIYLLVIIVATSVVEPEALSQTSAPLLTVVQRAAPAVPDRLFVLISLFAVANTGLLNFITGSRLLYGMANQGLLPSVLARVHPRRRTPHVGILTVFFAAGVLAASGTLSVLAGATSALLLIVFFTVNVSLIVVRLRDEPADGFRVPLVIPAVGAVTCIALIPFAPRESIVTALLVGLGGPVIAAVQRRRTPHGEANGM